MATTVEPEKSMLGRDHRAAGLVPLALAIPSLTRGVSRIGDGHPLSGWLMLGGGALMAGSAVWIWLRARP